MEAHMKKSEGGKSKKPFTHPNKRQQRNEKFKKHLGSSSEGQGFADKRKKKIQFEYLKLLKKEKLQKSRKGPDEPHTQESRYRHKQQHQKGMSTFSGLVHKQKQQKHKAQKEKAEADKKQQERQSAIQTSQKKRKQNYKLLCKRTSKGQPVMKTQMEFLLSKIEKQINQT